MPGFSEVCWPFPFIARGLLLMTSFQSRASFNTQCLKRVASISLLIETSLPLGVSFRVPESGHMLPTDVELDSTRRVPQACCLKLLSDRDAPSVRSIFPSARVWAYASD